MTTACDLAKYITEQRGSMSAMKLQKLVYYTHAWHLVATDGAPLLDEPIEAFAHGPLVRDLWYMHRGKTTVAPGDFASGDSEAVTPQVRELVSAVLAKYGDCTAYQLRARTHAEAPWKDAAQHGSDISDESMFEFYSVKSATDTDSVVLPSWAPIVISDEEYADMMDGVDVPDDASSLIENVRAARAQRL